MKKRINLIIAVCLILSVCFTAHASQQASSPGSMVDPASETLLDNPCYENAGGVSEYGEKQELSYSKDVTGDNVDDKIIVRAKEDGIVVFVNGNTALEIDQYADFFSIQYIRINAENEFLVIDMIDDPGYDGTFSIFRYNTQTNRLDFIQDLRTMGPGRFAEEIENIELSGNRLLFTALTQQSAIGGLYFNVEFVFENNRFVTEYKEMDYSSDNSVKTFTCGFDLDFYQSPGSVTKCFSAAKGSSVTIEKVFFDASYTYGYFTQGNNAGWMCFDSSQPYYAFKETWHFN